MSGPAGSGKSTFAGRLEDEGMVRLSFDLEMWRRRIPAVPPPRGRPRQQTNTDQQISFRSR